MSENNSNKKTENIFSKLTTLFRSGPVVKRKIMSYDTTVAAAPNINDKSSGHMLFQKSSNISYTEALAGTYQLADRTARYQDFNEMEYCLSGDTKVATETGFQTLKALSEKYGLDENFTVFSYDHNLKKIVAAKAKQARKTRTDNSFKVKFSDGREIIGSGNHRLLLREGIYCRIDELKVGDKLFPFLTKQSNNSTLICTFEKGESNSWTDQKNLLTNIQEYNQSNFQKRKLTFGQLVEAASRFDFNLNKICQVFDVTEEEIDAELLKYNYSSFENFIKTYNIHIRKSKPEKNFDSIARFYKEGLRINSLSDKLGCTNKDIEEIVKNKGYSDIENFLDSFSYVEVSSVQENGVIDLYDLTVDGYKNFATDTVISHNTPEIAAALDIYADETCAQDEKGKTLHVYSNNHKIKKLLEELFYNTLNVEFSLRAWARSLCKYGDFFLFNDISPKYGVINVFPIPVSEIERHENYDHNDPFAVRFKWLNRGNRFLENWEITHMRLLGNDMFLPYGSAIIEPARRIWKQLTLIEDAMLVYRLVRAPERRVFYVDVGNLPAESVPTYVEQLRKNLKTNQVVDKSSGKIDLRYNPQSIEEDYFIPVRGADTGTKIESLAGGQNTSAVEDVEYLQKKLFASLKIPRAYLGYDETLASKSTLAQEDIRFSRTINVIQRTIISELNKLAIIHLFANGYDGDDLMDFVLHLSNPSTIAQIQKMEVWKTKFELAGTVPEGMLSKTFIRKELLGLNDDQIEQIDNERIEEKIRESQIEAATEEVETVEEEMPEEEMAAEEGGQEEATPEAGAEESAEEILGSLNAAKEKNETYPIKALRDVVRQKQMDIDIVEEKLNALQKYKKNRKRKRIKKNLVNLSNYVNPGESLSDPYDIKSITSGLFDNKQQSEERPQLSDNVKNMLVKMNEKMSVNKVNKLINENS